jgi:hypothetical protein
MTNTTNEILNKLSSMILLQMYVSQATEIKTGSIEAKYLKDNMSLIDTTQRIQDSQLSITSFSDLLQISTPLIVNQKVRKTLYRCLSLSETSKSPGLVTRH